ncbi:GNAT family N-acetyltransferase [Deinococcus misasensis]|uniref:GNAT family N-acetyltransferase n=1 Tax=Deinococcus misasensis TaxID=392413 RepID=UPI000553CF14|nr:GNAT family N-acetyltransferase [Deinococcus misasensis]
MTYTFRRATPSDLHTLAEHRYRMFADMGLPEAQLEDVREAFLPWVEKQMQAGTYLTFLAEKDGQVVAGAALMWMDWPPGPLDARPGRGYLLNVYTHPEHRKQGLARLLVEQAIQECRERKVKVLSLHASEFGRPIYEKLGFQSTNEMRIHLGEHS